MITARRARRSIVVIAAALLFLTLTGCTGSQVITSTQMRVVLPDPALYVCNTVREWPDATALTDVQVARLLVQLYQNNEQCAASLATIRQFLDAAATSAGDRPAGGGTGTGE